ncbi:MAG TPA: ParB N-terminal domain-containing protein [Spirochaetia bacterium]|nr:ParB N-terminal domain-containing protein [Spirochaetia bacterium]
MEDSRDVAIDKIRKKYRIRKDLGDLTSLMNSLKKYGQLSPIILNNDYELIAGERRLESAKRLGWTNIKAVVISRETDLERLELEIEENIQRRELNPEEISDAFDRLDRLRNPTLLKRILLRIINFFKRLFRKREK